MVSRLGFEPRTREASHAAPCRIGERLRVGRRGRFSTDLDFAIAQDAFGEHVIVALEQGHIEAGNVRFEARSVDLPAAKATWLAVVARHQGICGTIRGRRLVAESGQRSDGVTHPARGTS